VREGGLRGEFAVGHSCVGRLRILCRRVQRLVRRVLIEIGDRWAMLRSASESPSKDVGDVFSVILLMDLGVVIHPRI